MVSVNYSAREVCCKIVYYGPGLSGKTTNLQYVHAKVPDTTRGQLISLATEADRTLYFDFLPINIGTINGFQAKFQLYTVPGQVYYNATRKLVLRGVDGIVFVADSQPDKMDENIESLANLQDNLLEYGYDLDTLPLVIQYNKRDLPGVLPVDELQATLNTRGWPHFEASATVGNGIFDTLKLVIKLVLDKAKSTSSGQPTTAVAAEPNRVEPVPEAVSVETATPTPAVVEQSPLAEKVVASVAASVTPSDTGPDVTEAEPTASVGIREPVFRPYPGSGEVHRTESVAVEDLAVESSDDVTETPKPQPNSATEVVDKSQKTDAILTGPQMAPSLRRREAGKKRGFFKRLLGIR